MKTTLKDTQIKVFDDIMKEAQEAATKAVQEEFPFNENPTYRNEGACGFAWVNVAGRGNFGKYAKDILDAHKNYGGKGFNIWYSNFYDTKGNQSYERHMIACSAAVKVFKSHGIKCYADGRLD